MAAPNRASLKRHVVRRTSVRLVYRDKLTVLREAAHPGVAAVRGYVTDQAGNRTTMPWQLVPDAVAERLPVEDVYTDRGAPIRQAVFLRFRAWKTLTGKTNGKKRARAILRRVRELLNLPELNNPDNPDRIDNGVFRLLPRTARHLELLQAIVAENDDCLLPLSDRL